MSLWLRTPERVPSRFSCDAEAPPSGRSAALAVRPEGPRLAARLLQRLSHARDARLRRGAASW